MPRAEGSSARDWVAPPNLVTLTRLVLVVPALLLLANGHRLWAALVVALVFITDGLDGFLARRLGRVTDLGKILDPTADKVAVGAIFLYLVIVGEFPLWAFALVLARDAAIALFGVQVMKRSGAVPQALPAGKVALTVLAAVAVVFVADLEVLKTAALIALTAAVLWSGATYAVSAARAFRARVFE